jgi:hypothetical protein
MATRPEHAVPIRRYLDAVLARDPAALAAALAADVVEVFPQSGERVRGSAAVVELLRRHPTPPTLVAGPFVTSCAGDVVLVEAKFEDGGEPWWFVDRFGVDGDRIRRMTSYFGQPFEAPDWRRPFVHLEPTIDPARWADDGDGQPVDRATVERYLQALVDRDPLAQAGLRHPEFRGLYPQSGERFDSAGAMAEARGYPGGLPTSRPIEIGGGTEDWVLTPLGVPIRVVGESDTWFGEASVVYPNGERLFSVTVMTFRAGLVWRARTYFCPPFEPAPWRAEIVERFDPLAGLG